MGARARNLAEVTDVVQATSANTSMPVLVTGVSGFIGSHLASHLVQLGVPVRGLVRQVEQASMVEKLGIRPALGDLTDPRSLAVAAQGCAVLYHCAAWMGAPFSWEAAFAVNAVGTRHLLEACLAAGVARFVYVSTISVYGPTVTEVIDEHTPLWPLGPYRASKIAAESAVMSASRRGLATVILRPGQVFGPGDGRLAPFVLRWLARGLPLLVDGGHGFCHPVYIDNLIDALLAAGTVPEASGQVLNVADGDVPWRHFLGHYARIAGRPLRSVPRWIVGTLASAAEMLAAIKRRPVALSRAELGYFLRTSRFSTAAARAVLHWAPRVPPDQAMSSTEAWLRHSGLLRNTPTRG